MYLSLVCAIIPTQPKRGVTSLRGGIRIREQAKKYQITSKKIDKQKNWNKHGAADNATAATVRPSWPAPEELTHMRLLDIWWDIEIALPNGWYNTEWMEY